MEEQSLWKEKMLYGEQISSALTGTLEWMAGRKYSGQ